MGLAFACILAAGCGGGGKPEVKPIEGPAKEVAAVVKRFETAMRQRDFATVCQDLLAASVRARSGGADCPRIFGERARDVKRPRIRIDAIEVSGNTARATVRTTATGQASAQDTIRLVRERGRFRIASLGG
jgi:ketosteroid isomerase-like protein